MNAAYQSKIIATMPNLAAYKHSTNSQLYVWCVYGKKYHLHGVETDGMRSAHCGVCKQNTGKGHTSYNLVYVGEMPDILKKDLSLKRQKGPLAHGYPVEFQV